MTSPIIVEEEDSVLVSSSGSSPVLLTDPDSDFLEVLPTSSNSHFSQGHYLAKTVMREVYKIQTFTK